LLNVVKAGQQLSLDSSGNLLINLAAGSISGGNLAASLTGAAVPSNADYVGVSVGGTLAGVSGLSLTHAIAATVAIVDASGNQITSFGGSGGNTAAGPTGSAVPADADYVGYNSGGNLIGVSTANPLPVAQQGSVAVTGTFFQATQPVSGTVTANAGTGTFNIQSNASVNLTQLNSVALGSPSAYGTSPGAVNVAGVNAFITNTPAVTLTSTTITGTVAVTQSGVWTDTVTQATAANLNATVVGTGTFAVQAAQSGPWTVQQGTSPWVIQDTSDGTYGALNPATAQQVAGSDGTYLRTLLTNSTGQLIVGGIGGQSDISTQMLLELRSMKAAIVAMVTESGKFKPEDFNSYSFDDEHATQTAGQ
jgi:hypothetical protein